MPKPHDDVATTVAPAASPPEGSPLPWYVAPDGRAYTLNNRFFWDGHAWQPTPLAPLIERPHSASRAWSRLTVAIVAAAVGGFAIFFLIAAIVVDLSGR